MGVLWEVVVALATGVCVRASGSVWQRVRSEEGDALVVWVLVCAGGARARM